MKYKIKSEADFANPKSAMISRKKIETEIESDLNLIELNTDKMKQEIGFVIQKDVERKPNVFVFGQVEIKSITPIL